ncbi:MAG: hypothetical protein HKN43_08515 [Rhodothermales bacterium]|nr:hypothetical protein [Rhodothermales bacterium]
MGKFAAISVAILTVVGAQYFMSGMQSARSTNVSNSNSQYEVLARQAALAGMNVAKLKLSESFESTTEIGQHQSSDYEVVATVSGTSADIVSTGTIMNADGESFSYEISARYDEVFSPLASAAPEFMSYAVLSGGDLNINGSLTLPTSLVGINSDIHTNGDLHISGSTSSVQGFGTYAGSVSANPAPALYTTFSPVSNDAELSSVYKSSVVDIPDFDISAFVDAIELDKSSESSQSVSGPQNFGGTRENPYVWYIDGDLNVGGTTVLDGYNIFLINGNFDIKGQLLSGSTGYAGDESSIAIYASGKVDLTGSSTVEAQVFSGKDVSMLHGSPIVVGSITTLGTLRLSGSPQINFRSASPGLTTIWQPRSRFMALSEYFEK